MPRSAGYWSLGAGSTTYGLKASGAKFTVYYLQLTVQASGVSSGLADFIPRKIDVHLLSTKEKSRASWTRVAKNLCVYNNHLNTDRTSFCPGYHSEFLTADDRHRSVSVCCRVPIGPAGDWLYWWVQIRGTTCHPGGGRIFSFL